MNSLYFNVFKLYLTGYSNCLRRIWKPTLVESVLYSYINGSGVLTAIKPQLHKFSVNFLNFSTFFRLRNIRGTSKKVFLRKTAYDFVLEGGLRVKRSSANLFFRPANLWCVKACKVRQRVYKYLTIYGTRAIRQCRRLVRVSSKFLNIFKKNKLLGCAPLLKKEYTLAARLFTKNVFTFGLLTRYRLHRLHFVWLKKIFRISSVKSFFAKPRRFASTRYIKHILNAIQVYCMRYGVRLNFFGTLTKRRFTIIQHTFFKMVRLAKPLRMMSIARKLGIWPRRSKFKFKNKSWKNRNKRITSHTMTKGSQTPLSVFSRNNYQSMQLLWDFPRERSIFVLPPTLFKTFRVLKRMAHKFVKLVIRLRRLVKARFKRRKILPWHLFFKRRYRRARPKRIFLRKLVKSVWKLSLMSKDANINKWGLVYILKRKTRLKIYSMFRLRLLIMRKFFFTVYERLVRLKTLVSTSFFKNSKILFLFVFIKEFCKKTAISFGLYINMYREIFGEFEAVAAFFNRSAVRLLSNIVGSLTGNTRYLREAPYIFNKYLLLTASSSSLDCVKASSWFQTKRLEQPSYLQSRLFGNVVTLLIPGSTDFRLILNNIFLFANDITTKFNSTKFLAWHLSTKSLSIREQMQPYVVQRTFVFNKPARSTKILRNIRRSVFVYLRGRQKLRKAIAFSSRKQIKVSQQKWLWLRKRLFLKLKVIKPFLANFPWHRKRLQRKWGYNRWRQRKRWRNSKRTINVMKKKIFSFLRLSFPRVKHKNVLSLLEDGIEPKRYGVLLAAYTFFNSKRHMLSGRLNKINSYKYFDTKSSYRMLRRKATFHLIRRFKGSKYNNLKWLRDPKKKWWVASRGKRDYTRSQYLLKWLSYRKSMRNNFALRFISGDTRRSRVFVAPSQSFSPINLDDTDFKLNNSTEHRKSYKKKGSL